MSCFGLQLTCRQKPEWMRTLFLTDVSQSQYEREIARLYSQVRRLEGEVEEWKALNEDNCVLEYINAIALERWINEHVLPKMRTQFDAKWLLSELEPFGDLGYMIHFHDQMLMRGVMSSLEAKIEEQVRPVENEEHVAWGFMAPGFDILLQFRGQNNTRTGLEVMYDEHGLAQAPSQVSM